jgi:hypothetical protein
MFRVILSLIVLFGIAIAKDSKPAPASDAAAAQNATPAGQSATSQKTTPIAISRAQRLGAAKTAFIRKVEGSEIPVNVVTDSMQGWGRYTLVSAPEKADLIIEITAPPEQPASVTINGSHTNPLTGHPESSTSTSHNISNVPIRMIVLDSKTKLPLFTATEQPKHAMKQKTREDNLVEAAQALFMKFHQAVEPNGQ